jgi:hypothetical protein
VDIRVAQLLSRLTGENGAIATATVHQEFAGLVRKFGFQIPLQNPLSEMLGPGNVSAEPFVILADIKQQGLRIGVEPLLRLWRCDFRDARLRFFDELEKAGGMLHGAKVSGSPKWANEFPPLQIAKSPLRFSIDPPGRGPLAFEPPKNGGKTMIGTIRKHSNFLWVIVIIFTVVSFVIFFTPEVGNLSGQKINYGTAYGIELTREERVAAELETRLYVFNQIRQWPDSSMTAQVNAMAMRRCVLLKRAELEGINVPDEAVARYLKRMFSDRETQKFSLANYNEFTTKLLPQNGINESQFEDYIRHEIALGQLNQMAGQSAGLISTRAAKSLFERENETVEAMAVFLQRSNQLTQVKIETNAITSYFTNNIGTYRIPERTVVDYVYFSFTNYFKQAETNLTTQTNLAVAIDGIYAQRGTNDFKDDDGKVLGAEDAKKKIRERMIEEESTQVGRTKMKEFANAVFRIVPVSAANLHNIAKEMGYEVKSTAPFTELDGPADLDVPNNFASAAFNLSVEEPLASPLQWVDGVYIIAFNQRLPPKNPELTNVWNDVVRDYRRDQSSEMNLAAGLKLAKSIKQNLASGLTFEAACHTNGTQAIKLPPFTRFTRSIAQVEDFAIPTSEFANQAFDLEEGYSSEFVETGNGGFIAFTHKRTPVSNALATDGIADFVLGLREERQRQVLGEWTSAQLAGSGFEEPEAR